MDLHKRVQGFMHLQSLGAVAACKAHNPQTDQPVGFPSGSSSCAILEVGPKLDPLARFWDPDNAVRLEREGIFDCHGLCHTLHVVLLLKGILFLQGRHV